jgi:hypothetical protein
LLSSGPSLSPPPPPAGSVILPDQAAFLNLQVYPPGIDAVFFPGGFFYPLGDAPAVGMAVLDADEA